MGSSSPVRGHRLADTNPDKLSHEALAAELTNHLIPGVVLTPGAVGTLPDSRPASTTQSEDGTMRKRFLFACLGSAALLLAGSGVAEAAQDMKPDMKVPGFATDVFPPWQNGMNNDASERGLAFTVPEVDDMADFHGDLTDPKLVLFVGGNYYFAMAPLVQAFEASHPELKGRLFWETMPPDCWSIR